VSATDPSADNFIYDEFAYVGDNLTDLGLPALSSPDVARVSTEVETGRRVSALRWGSDPKIVFVHGSAQNAHTWDTVVLLLEMSTIAVDLPGHGHSDWRSDRGYSPHTMANDIAAVMREHAPQARTVVGMSLGGMVTMALASRHPTMVDRLITVDVTPGVTREKAKHIHDFVAGPQTFPSFSEIFDRTVQFNPTRSASSLRRGIVHNAKRLPDGSWEWRYDRRGPDAEAPASVPTDLWSDVETISADHLLVRGGADGSVVDDEDVAELKRRRPASEVVVVPDAGHSIQGDQPVALARIIAEFAGR
jgi:esterase